jgi:hypothetical protein
VTNTGDEVRVEGQFLRGFAYPSRGY